MFQIRIKHVCIKLSQNRCTKINQTVVRLINVSTSTTGYSLKASHYKPN